MKRQVRVASVSARKKMWIYSWQDERSTDYITLVGRYEQDKRKPLLIDLQFNFPSERFDRQKGGAFVVDGEGNAWLAHRCIVTRGHSRLKREEVLEKLLPRRPVTVASDTRPFKVSLLLVARLDAPDLAAKVLKFAVEMRDAATLVAAAQPLSQNPEPKHGKGKNKTGGKKTGDKKPRGATILDGTLWKYRDEFSGERTVTRKSQVVMRWTHGRIVAALRKKFQADKDVLQSQAADLIVRRGKTLHLYEVKPSRSKQSVYTAIGQLVFNAVSLEDEFKGHQVRKFLVLPGMANMEARDERCKELGFELVTFKSQGKSYAFNGLPK